MSKYLLTLVFAFHHIFVFSQRFIWANNSVITNTISEGLYVAVDEKGSVYVTGGYSSVMKLGNQTFTAMGREDVFLAKYNAQGDLKWAIQNPCSEFAYPTSICYDHHGSIYMTGQYEGTIMIGPNTYTALIGVASGFLAKYDTSGNFIWSQNYPTTGNLFNYVQTMFSVVQADANGEILLSGGTNSTLPVMIDTILVSAPGSIIAKFNSSGHAIWLITGNAVENISTIKMCSSGNYYATRYLPYFIPPNTQFIYGNDTIYTNAYNDGIIIKYDSLGTVSWAKCVPGPLFSGTNGVDSSDNFYILGYSLDSTKFFIAKYDSTGNLNWKKYLSGITTVIMTVNEKGEIYLSGSDTFSSMNYSSTFISKLDASGNTLWYNKENSPLSYNYGVDIALTGNGNVYVAGYFYPSLIRFGNQLLTGGKEQPHENSFYIALINDSSYHTVHANKITGNIFEDVNFNCIPDIGENKLAGYTVMAQPGNYFAVSDIAGNYSINVDSAIYTVSQLISPSHSLNYFQNCPAGNASYSINAQSSNSTFTGNDFSNNVTMCPFLSFFNKSQGINFLCNDTVRTSFDIRNSGFTPSINTMLTMHYSSELIPLSSSPTWTSINTADTSISFNLGTLLPDSFITISILDSVTCNSLNFVDIPYNHWLQLTPVNYCIVGDSIFSLDTLFGQYFLPVGLIEHNEKTSFKLFPNPNNGNMTIEFHLNAAKGVLQIYDVAGRIVDSYNLPREQNQFIINNSTIENGLYFYSFIDGNTPAFKGKFILIK